MLALPLAPPQEVFANPKESKAWQRMPSVAKACLSREHLDRPTASQVVTAWNLSREAEFVRAKLGKTDVPLTPTQDPIQLVPHLSW